MKLLIIKLASGVIGLFSAIFIVINIFIKGKTYGKIEYENESNNKTLDKIDEINKEKNNRYDDDISNIVNELCGIQTKKK